MNKKEKWGGRVKLSIALSLLKSKFSILTLGGSLSLSFSLSFFSPPHPATSGYRSFCGFFFFISFFWGGVGISTMN
jgi:hypothetical protein